MNFLAIKDAVLSHENAECRAKNRIHSGWNCVQSLVLAQVGMMTFGFSFISGLHIITKKLGLNFAFVLMAILFALSLATKSDYLVTSLCSRFDKCLSLGVKIYCLRGISRYKLDALASCILSSHEHPCTGKQHCFM